MVFLQDLIHCKKHCMQNYTDEWICGLKKHTEFDTKGCFFGTLNWSDDFKIEEEDFFKLPDPDDFDKDEYVYTMEEINEKYGSPPEEESEIEEDD